MLRYMGMTCHPKELVFHKNPKTCKGTIFVIKSLKEDPILQKKKKKKCKHFQRLAIFEVENDPLVLIFENFGKKKKKNQPYFEGEKS